MGTIAFVVSGKLITLASKDMVLVIPSLAAAVARTGDMKQRKRRSVDDNAVWCIKRLFFFSEG